MQEKQPPLKNENNINKLLEVRQKNFEELQGLKKKTNNITEIFIINELETKIKGIDSQLNELQ